MLADTTVNRREFEEEWQLKSRTLLLVRTASAPARSKTLSQFWVQRLAVDLAGTAKRKQGRLKMEQSEEATQKDNADKTCAKDSTENQTNEATGQVLSEEPNSGSVCKQSEETETRYDRLKLFNKVMQKSLEKFVEHAR